MVLGVGRSLIPDPVLLPAHTSADPRGARGEDGGRTKERRACGDRACLNGIAVGDVEQVKEAAEAHTAKQVETAVDTHVEHGDVVVATRAQRLGVDRGRAV